MIHDVSWEDVIFVTTRPIRADNTSALLLVLVSHRSTSARCRSPSLELRLRSGGIKHLFDEYLSMSTSDQLLYSALHTVLQYAAERRNLDEAIEELRQIAAGDRSIKYFETGKLAAVLVSGWLLQHSRSDFGPAAARRARTTEGRSVILRPDDDRARLW